METFSAVKTEKRMVCGKLGNFQENIWAHMVEITGGKHKLFQSDVMLSDKSYRKLYIFSCYKYQLNC